MYTQAEFLKNCGEAFRQTAGNAVDIPGAGRTVLYDAPLIGFAAASDELFGRYKQPEVIGLRFTGPVKWLPGAETVVSLFFPLSEAVRASNRQGGAEPSQEWLWARVEGQAFIDRCMTAIRQRVTERGADACVPGLDERFSVSYGPGLTGGETDFHADSRWSERHAAYACGPGTFGLSRGLITQRGMAGRFASLIVSAAWTPSGRGYAGIDDWCIRCGSCARNCPAGAISLEHGKNNARCKAFLNSMEAKYSPRYGCGKCQVGVPCEACRPGQRGKS